MTTTERKLKALICEHLCVDESEITRDASFRDDLGADSLDAVELIMTVEEEFGIPIDDEIAERLTTFGKLLDYVDASVGHKKGAA